MTSVTLDRETLNGIAERLDGGAPELTDAERTQLMAVLAVGSSEVARRARLQYEAKEAEVEPLEVLGDSFHEALQPLLGAEVELFDATTLVVLTPIAHNPTPPMTTSSSGGASQTVKK